MTHQMKKGQPSPRRAFAAASLLLGLLISACHKHATYAPRLVDSSRESIYVLRSIRELPTRVSAGCASTTTGFAPYGADAERVFSFWSVSSRAVDGRVVNAGTARVAQLRGCFGPTDDRTRQNFYAEIALGSLSFHGRGDCLALAVDVPEAGLYPVRCQLVLSGLPAPFVGGLLTTNTITSRAAYGGDTDPPGYTQASIATIRLWKRR